MAKEIPRNFEVIASTPLRYYEQCGTLRDSRHTVRCYAGEVTFWCNDYYYLGSEYPEVWNVKGYQAGSEVDKAVRTAHSSLRIRQEIKHLEAANETTQPQPQNPNLDSEQQE